MLVDLGLPSGTVTVVAQDPAPPPGQGEEFGKASPIALVVIILLGLALVVLIVSMSKRIRRLPASFDEKPGPDSEDAGDTRS
jgi:hypothetical protein